MKGCTVNRGLLAVCGVVLLLGVPDLASAQSCTQTLSVGANIASTVAGAADNSTICLNSGNYGSVRLTNIDRSAYVTLRSTSGTGAIIEAIVSNSKFIRFQALTISGGEMVDCSRNIQFLSSIFTAGLLFSTVGTSCSYATPFNILIDGNLFGDIGTALYEGRLSIAGNNTTQPIGITVSNNHFGPGCQSDGIQVAGDTVGLMIGPGNVFEGINQSGPIHCDSIQFYSGGRDNIVTGNWFKNSSVALMHQGGSPNNTSFTNNVISNTGQVQVGGVSGFLFEHNTVFNMNYVFRFNTQPSTGVTYRSNIILSSSAAAPPGGVTTASYNLCDLAADCSGTNQIIGTPTFVGGSPASISTFAGWQLASTSLGRNAAHDGLDVGVRFGTPPPPSAPHAPTNLRIMQ